MWLTIALFIILSPGLLFRLGNGFAQMVFMHTALFAACLFLARMTLKGVRIEGFQDKHVEGWQLGSSCGDEYCRAPKVFCKEDEEGVKYCSETE